ncbi:hypothetical protein CH63R_11182 [Colletotrichum higginsianum IMI 349063]|uniref:Uncharacterized protein n=1 Tax=Colletotrichum higginsianum (strain IMI 349063) TaxID=759273 RepID=A0A1B7XXJ8_COLHI|nr:hypothetical protein CH63R_11182 [Colletotrichum higginsianum IMI 349063]OBR04479.1 hypothetical protein CH63R_11182 [Colletotrichum higginsianum IMI 349063]
MWPSSETGLVIAARLGNSRYFVFLRNSSRPSLQLRDDRGVDRDASDSGVFFAVVLIEIGLCGIKFVWEEMDQVGGNVKLKKENKSGNWWESRTPSILGARRPIASSPFKARALAFLGVSPALWTWQSMS